MWFTMLLQVQRDKLLGEPAKPCLRLAGYMSLSTKIPWHRLEIHIRRVWELSHSQPT